MRSQAWCDTHSFSPSTLEAEAEQVEFWEFEDTMDSFEQIAQGHPEPHCEFLSLRKEKPEWGCSW